MLFYPAKKNIFKRKGYTSFHDSPPDLTDEVVLGKRVSHIASLCPGSLTIEASIVIPVFMLAITSLIFIIQVIQIQIHIQKALYNQMMKVTGYGYYVNHMDLSTEAENFLQEEYIKLMVIDELGEDFFDKDVVVNGKYGFILNLSNISEDGLLDVVLMYKLKMPLDFFNIGKINMVARARCATWTGAKYDSNEWDTNMVYMTAKGEVYHTDKECTYIKSDISQCSYSEVSNKRNASGGIYYPCSLCSDREISNIRVVYYTQYGNRYHIMEFCSNLKSNVFAIERSVAVLKYKECSKCGLQGEKND